MHQPKIMLQIVIVLEFWVVFTVSSGVSNPQIKKKQGECNLSFSEKKIVKPFYEVQN